MKNSILRKATLALLGVATLSWFSPNTNAVPITGSVSISGEFQAVDDIGLPALDLSTATQFYFANCLVNSTGLVGDYTGTAGASVLLQGFRFEPFSPVATVAQFNVAESVYAFDLNTLAITTDTSTLLEFDGAGFAHITGKDATHGTIRVTATKGLLELQGTALFQFTADTVQVPDSGTTMVLLGAALTSLGFLRRRFGIQP